MNWQEQIDGYCERLGPEFWAEPVNALTNGGFILVALWMWQRSKGVFGARVLCAILFAIGLGSFLLHSFAQPWAAAADVAPIVDFVLIYLFLATRDFLGQKRRYAALAVVLFIPYSAVIISLLGSIAWLGESLYYLPVPLLIALYALALRKRQPSTAWRLAVGAGVILVSLFFRTIDAPLCPAFPLGTHFIWHLLNALALGWMIETYRLHRCTEPLAQRGLSR